MGDTSRWINTPTLSVELYITCPECEEYFDLFDTSLNDEGELMNEILPESRWIDAHKNFECEATCPKCSVEFPVKGVNW